jgi:hypothetical protein
MSWQLALNLFAQTGKGKLFVSMAGGFDLPPLGLAGRPVIGLLAGWDRQSTPICQA